MYIDKKQNSLYAKMRISESLYIFLVMIKLSYLISLVISKLLILLKSKFQ